MTMKKILSFLLIAFLATQLCQAQNTNATPIDHVNVVQKIDLNTCDVYIVPTIEAQMKDDKKKKEQQVAFNELGKTILRELKVAFREGSYQVIADAKDAPAGSVVIEACLKEIEWGSSALRQLTYGAGGKIAGSYSVKVTKDKGLVLEFDTRREHYTSGMTSSDMSPDVIRTYNRAIASDLLSVLRKM